jgi:hypothetical protein
MSKFQKDYMPYGMRELQEGRWELSNRHYDTLGKPFTFARKLSTETIKSLAASDITLEKGSGLQTVWFYTDGSVPTDKDEHWQSYSAKLQKLSSLKVE